MHSFKSFSIVIFVAIVCACVCVQPPNQRDPNENNATTSNHDFDLNHSRESGLFNHHTTAHLLFNDFLSRPLSPVMEPQIAFRVNSFFFLFCAKRRVNNKSVFCCLFLTRLHDLWLKKWSVCSLRIRHWNCIRFSISRLHSKHICLQIFQFLSSFFLFQFVENRKWTFLNQISLRRQSRHTGWWSLNSLQSH